MMNKLQSILSLLLVALLLASCEKATLGDTNPPVSDGHYTLPVVFHVMYKDKTAPLQYIPQQRLSEILATVNKLYKDKINSNDMDLTFTLATTDPLGREMNTPGVEYIEWKHSFPIDPYSFMNDDINNGGKGHIEHLWDPNRYINVMIYNFAPNSESSLVTLGVSHLPFSTNGDHFLEGTNPTNYASLALENLGFPYCVSINSNYIYDESTSTTYKPSSVIVTLAHELGHYLGLHHAFAQNPRDGLLDSSKDTDYCQDTPSYNRIKYEKYSLEASKNPLLNTFDNLVKREDGAGKVFISRNIMDYSVSYSNLLTLDQRARVRNILNYSPLIPGAKLSKASSRVAAPKGVLDLPILTVE